MKRPLAYITAPWSANEAQRTDMAAHYCRRVYEAGYAPVCPALYIPFFVDDAIPTEHKDGIDMARNILRRAHLLVVCGNYADETVKNDVAVAERLHITATTLDGLIAVSEIGHVVG